MKYITNKAAMINEDSIIINLDELEKTSPIPQNNLIFKKSFEELKAKIIEKTNKNVDRLKSTGDKETVLYQPCFFVNGGRGSGKSTILRSLRRELHCSEDIKLHFLADIDPTELAETENFLIHILGCFQKIIQDINYIKYSENYDSKKNDIKHAYKCIKVMTKGLSLIARNLQNMPLAGDADYYVQESINECASSAMIKETFADLADTICRIKNTDALLVTVDDGDMNFNKCSEVFETVRKYLINPRLVFVFAGDEKLYTMVVRGMQMHHFGKMTLKFDDEIRRSLVYKLLDNLGEQYIMKLFPVENRISLMDYGIIMSKNIRFRHSKYKGGKDVPLLQYLQVDLKEFDIYHHDVDIVGYMTSLPVRSVFQLVSYWVKYIHKKNSRDENMLQWCNGIRYVVSSSLIKHGISCAEIRNNGRRGLEKSVLWHAKKMQLGAAGARMLPGIGDDSMQMVSFYLTSEVARLVRTIPDIISYMLNVFPYLQRYGSDVPLSEKLLNQLSSDTQSNKGVECTNAIILFNKRGDRKLFSNGVIPLFPSEHRGSNINICRISSSFFFSKIKTAIEKEKKKEDILYYIALYHTLCPCEINGTDLFCLSIYKFLFLLQRLLKIQDVTQEEKKKSIKKILFDLNIGLSVNDKIRSGYSSITETNLAYFLKQLSDYKCIEIIVDEVYEWLNDSKDLKCTAVSMHSGWNEFMQRCADISDAARIRSIDEQELVKAGDLLCMYMDAFSQSLVQSLKKNNNEVDVLIDTCPLWKSLRGENKSMLDLLNEVNIAPVDGSFNLDKFKTRCTMRLKQTAAKVGRTTKNYLAYIEQKHMEWFSKWCERNIETSRLNFVTAAIEANKGVPEFGGILKKKLTQILEEVKVKSDVHKAELSDELHKLRERYEHDLIGVLEVEAEKCKEELVVQLAVVEKEENAVNRLEEALRRFESVRAVFKEKIEDPMDMEAYDCENRMKEKMALFVKSLVDKYFG